MKTKIYSFDAFPSCSYNPHRTFALLRRILIESIVMSNFTGKARICMGAFSIHSNGDIRLKKDSAIHIIITGNEVLEFDNCIKEIISSTENASLFYETGSNENAFTYNNNHIVKKISWKNILYIAKKRKNFLLKECPTDYMVS